VLLVRVRCAHKCALVHDCRSFWRSKLEQCAVEREVLFPPSELEFTLDLAGLAQIDGAEVGGVVAIAGFGLGIAGPAANNAALELMPEKIAAITGMRGMFLLVEGVRQLRGEATGRQVENAKLCCVSGTGGWFSSASTVILGVE
jgi:hypothetical protein